MTKREATRALRDLVGEIALPAFRTEPILNMVVMEIARRVHAIDAAIDKEGSDASTS
jgi:hypothetical protein